LNFGHSPLTLCPKSKTKIKFSFRINKVCVNKIEDKKIHQLTRDIQNLSSFQQTSDIADTLGENIFNL